MELFQVFAYQVTYSTIRLVDKIYELQDVKYYPVLVAHNTWFNLDFLILLSELQRQTIPFHRLPSINLNFADTSYDCKKGSSVTMLFLLTGLLNKKTLRYK